MGKPKQRTASAVGGAGVWLVTFALDRWVVDIDTWLLVVLLVIGLVAILYGLSAWFRRPVEGMDSSAPTTTQTDSPGASAATAGRDAVVAGRDAFVGNKIAGRDFYEAQPAVKDERQWSRRTPEELVAIYRQGKTQAQADREFAASKGRWHRLEGTVQDHVVDEVTEYIVLRSPAHPTVRFQCFFNVEESESRTDLSAGDEITIEGQIESAMAWPSPPEEGRIVLTNCQVAED